MPEYRGLRILCWLGNSVTVLLFSSGLMVARGGTNAAPVPKDLLSLQTVWGAETNGLRAGANWELTDKMNVRIFVLTSKTNVAWTYVAPPGKKLMKWELRDAHGTLLSPLSGKAVAEDMPQRISTQNLPRRPASGIHHRSTIDNWLILGAGTPVIFRDIVIQDMYRIKLAGNYSLTLSLAVYEFSSDEQFVSRLVLPPVVLKLHLRESADP